MRARLAEADDWRAVLPLVCRPQGDGWGLAARFPQGLRAGLDGVRQHLAVVEHQERIVACGVRTVRRVLTCAGPALLGYLTLLRRAPDLPPHLALVGLRDAFACLAATRRDDELPVDFTSILDGNRRARRLLEAGLPGVPAYHLRVVYRTRIWSARTLARAAGGGVAGSTGWQPTSGLELQAAPGSDLTLLGDGDRAWGALVDHAATRATALTAMPPAIRRLRPLINACRRLRGMPAIPAAGADLPQHHLTGWGWRPGAAGAGLALAGALARGLPPDSLVVAGWCDDHPDAAALAAAAPPAEIVTARWYTVGGTLPAGPWQFEAGTL